MFSHTEDDEKVSSPRYRLINEQAVSHWLNRLEAQGWLQGNVVELAHRVGLLLPGLTPPFDLNSATFRQTLVKFLGHMHAFSGTVRVSSQGEIAKEIQFEGWNEAAFLYMQLVNLAGSLNKLAKESYQHWLCEREIIVVANAYQVLHDYQNILTQSDAAEVDTTLSHYFTAWVNALVATRADYPGMEWCLPAGSSDHAVYLNLFFDVEQRLWVRLDNLSYDCGAGERHQKANRRQQLYPKLLGYVNINKPDELDKLVCYLVAVAKTRQRQWQDEHTPSVVEVLYNENKANRLLQLDNIAEQEQAFPVMHRQTKDNCVCANYLAGAACRGLNLEHVQAQQLGTANRQQKELTESTPFFDALQAARQRCHAAKNKAAEAQRRHPLPENKHRDEFNAPYLAKDIIERKQAMSALANHFTLEAGPRRLVMSALSGMGGIGKTTLAAWLYHYPPKVYQFKAWLSGRDERSFREDIRSLGVFLKIIPADSQAEPQVLAQVAAHLAEQADTLLIIDNVDTDAMRDRVLAWLPQAALMDVLLTSRLMDWANLGIIAHQSLDLMSEEEALAMLRQRLGEANVVSEEALALIEALGSLPLALEQATAYLRARPGLSLASYLKRFNEQSATVMALPDKRRDARQCSPACGDDDVAHHVGNLAVIARRGGSDSAITTDGVFR